MNFLFSRLSLYFRHSFRPSFTVSLVTVLLLCVALALDTLIRGRSLFGDRSAEANDQRFVFRLIFRLRLSYDFLRFLIIDLRDFHHFKL